MSRLGSVLVACMVAVLATTASGTDGVKGTTVRPSQVKANVEGCKIAKPGSYAVSVGDLIELDYTYPVVLPSVIPKKVGFQQTLIGAVGPSALGIRLVSTPGLVGGPETIAFYFEGKKPGQDAVTLIIDGDEYAYKLTVK